MKTYDLDERFGDFVDPDAPPAPARKPGRPRKVPRCGHTEGPHHDCDYVDAVNKLIPVAERAAGARLQDYVEKHGMPDESESRKLWTWLFVEEMQVECEAEGLRQPVREVPA